MESVCNEIGLSLSAAFTIIAKKVARKTPIPFELNADPFYSKENMDRLKKAVEDAQSGPNIHEHELIEVDLMHKIRHDSAWEDLCALRIPVPA